MQKIEKNDFAFHKEKLDRIQQQTGTKRGAPLIRHTHIYHDAREKLGLSIIEYCVASIVRSYEGGKDSRENYGWVFASKETIARCLSINKRTVERAINILLEKSLLEKHSITKYLRTTEQWIKEIDYWKESSKKKV